MPPIRIKYWKLMSQLQNVMLHYFKYSTMYFIGRLTYFIGRVTFFNGMYDHHRTFTKILVDPAVIFSSHAMFINASTKDFTLMH